MTGPVHDPDRSPPRDDEGGTGRVVGHRTRRAARAVVILALSEMVAKVATFTLMVGAFRLLGQEQFGSFSYALNAGLLLATIPSWGFDPWLVRHGAGDRRRTSDLLSVLVTLRLLLIAPLLVVGAATGLLTRGGPAGAAFALVVAATLLDTLTDAGRAGAGALEAQGRVAVVLVIQRTATAAVGLTALAAGTGLVGLSAAYLLGSVTAVLAMAAVLRRLGLRLRRGAVTRPGLRAAVTGSFVIGVDAVVSVALFRVDTLLLGAIRGDTEVGAYSAAYRLIETVLFVNWAVTRALFPQMAAAADTEVWRVRRAVEAGLAVLAFAFVPYAAVLLVRGEELLDLIYGSGLAGAAGPLSWLALAPLTFGLGYLLSYAGLAVDRGGLVLVASTVAAVANVGANLALIPRYGATAAAATTTLSYLVECAVLLPFTRRDLDGRLRLARALVAPVVATLPVVAVLLLPLPVLVALPLAAATYVVCWYAAVRTVDPEQVQVLRTLLPGGRT